jgi:putative FmdB family regulatory protein
MTYEYICKNCGHLWEKDQSIKDKPLKKCPNCKKMTAQRLISNGAGFILRGNCWASTGYSS